MTSIHNLNPNVVKEAKRLASPPKVCLEKLDEYDIQWLLVKELKLKETHFKQKQSNVKNVNVDAELWEFILEKVKDELPLPVHKTGGNYFRTTTPFVVHTDTPHEKNITPYKNILIPLTTDSENCYTIMLTQRHYGVGAHFLKSDRYNHFTPDKNIKITDYTHLEHYTNKNIDKKLYEQYLTHMPYDNLHGLSIETVIKWKVGDIIFFDSTQLHCSNNFKSETPKEKHALSLFTNLGILNENHV
jgi:hypothetical protein